MPDSYVCVKIELERKDRAAAALAGRGLSLAEGVRLFVEHVADGGSLPFAVAPKAPASATRSALKASAEGRIKYCGCLDELLEAGS